VSAHTGRGPRRHLRGACGRARSRPPGPVVPDRRFRPGRARGFHPLPPSSLLPASSRMRRGTVGAGMGTTPAGDDVVCGVLAGLDLLGFGGAPTARRGRGSRGFRAPRAARVTCWRSPPQAATPRG
jgi:hypothetical protein